MATSDWYVKEHHDPDKSSLGKTMTYAKVRFDRLIDFYSKPDSVLNREAINDLLPGINISTRRSGTRIDDDLVVGIETLWPIGKRKRPPRDESFNVDVNKNDIREAAKYIDDKGLPPTFSWRTEFNVTISGKVYPPKAVFGLATRRSRGASHSEVNLGVAIHTQRQRLFGY